MNHEYFHTSIVTSEKDETAYIRKVHKDYEAKHSKEMKINLFEKPALQLSQFLKDKFERK